MVNWKDQEVIAYDFFLYEQIAVFLLGFYGCVSPAAFYLSRFPSSSSSPLRPPARLRFELEFGLECECESRPEALANIAC